MLIGFKLISNSMRGSLIQEAGFIVNLTLQFILKKASSSIYTYLFIASILSLPFFFLKNKLLSSSFAIDCQYILKFSMFISLYIGSSYFPASRSTKIGFQSRSVVPKVSNFREAPKLYEYCLFASSKRMWMFLTKNFRLSTIFLPSLSKVPSSLFISFIFPTNNSKVSLTYRLKSSYLLV